MFHCVSHREEKNYQILTTPKKLRFIGLFGLDNLVHTHTCVKDTQRQSNWTGMNFNFPNIQKYIWLRRLMCDWLFRGFFFSFSLPLSPLLSSLPIKALSSVFLSQKQFDFKRSQKGFWYGIAWHGWCNRKEIKLGMCFIINVTTHTRMHVCVLVCRVVYITSISLYILPIYLYPFVWLFADTKCLKAFEGILFSLPFIHMCVVPVVVVVVVVVVSHTCVYIPWNFPWELCWDFCCVISMQKNDNTTKK